MASAVIRVKRRLEEEPIEALILNCKRRKTNGETKDEETSTQQLHSTILKFAGTVKENENILAHLNNKPAADINELKSLYKKHGIDLSEKLRTEHQNQSKKNRYNIISCFRSVNKNNIEGEDGSSSKTDSNDVKAEVTIVDVATDLNENDNNTEDKNKLDEYVYDLYYTNSDDFGDADIDYVSVHPVLIEHNYFSREEPNDSDDSEDSNAENNWRNDYPDEDDMQSITEEDMLQAMKNVDLDEDLLSSDDGEEGFIYSVDSEAAGFEEDIDESDVHRYGERYARFKAKHKKAVESDGLETELYYGDIDEDEYYY